MQRHEIDTATLPEGWSLPEVARLAGFSRLVLGSTARTVGSVIEVVSDMTAVEVGIALVGYKPDNAVFRLSLVAKNFNEEKPNSTNWSSQSEMNQMLTPIFRETQQRDTHTITETWYRGDDVELGESGLSPKSGAEPYVKYEKIYTDGVIGPTSRKDNGTLYLTDGSEFTWSVESKLYDFDKQRSLSVKRRTYATRWLQALIASKVAMSSRVAGQSALAQLQPYVETLEVTGDASPLVSALTASASVMMAAPETELIGNAIVEVMPIIMERLSPWL